MPLVEPLTLDDLDRILQDDPTCYGAVGTKLFYQRALTGVGCRDIFLNSEFGPGRVSLRYSSGPSSWRVMTWIDVWKPVGSTWEIDQRIPGGSVRGG
jgi:hypothetical protein